MNLKNIEPELYTLGIFCGDSLDECFGKYYTNKEDIEEIAENYNYEFYSVGLFAYSIIPIKIYSDFDIENYLKNRGSNNE